MLKQLFIGITPIILLNGCSTHGSSEFNKASPYSLSAKTVNSGLTTREKQIQFRRYYESLGVVWDVPVKQKVIALTFDDGPNPKYTPQILKSLKKYHAKATFFITGKSAEYYPSLVKQEMADGHEVANHTYSHPRIWKLSNEQIKEEINHTQQIVVSLTGKMPTLFRPIGGYLSDQVVRVAKEQGSTVIIWSWHQDSQDWKQPGVYRIVNKVVSHARAGDIVLFHDHGRDPTQTVKAIQQILPILQQKGFQFVTVSELLQMRRTK